MGSSLSSTLRELHDEYVLLTAEHARLQRITEERAAHKYYQLTGQVRAGYFTPRLPSKLPSAADVLDPKSDTKAARASSTCITRA